MVQFSLLGPITQHELAKRTLTMSGINEVDVQSVVASIRLPPQPEILIKVHGMLQADDPDVAAIIRLLSADTGLSAAILKTVNSSLYSPARRIGSVADAVRLLGMRSVIQIVTCATMRQALHNGAHARLQRYWDTSLRIAIAAGAVAKALNIGSPEEAYTAGMFMDCGIPLLAERFPNYLEVLREANAGSEPCVDVEDRMLSTNHAVVGYYLTRSWNMPSTISLTALHHHRWQNAAEGSEAGNRRLLQILAVAKTAEHVETLSAMRNGGIDPEWERARPFVMEQFHLSEFDLYELCADTIDALPAI
jgi:HD-like signal output (HDOD) protein